MKGCVWSHALGKGLGLVYNALQYKMKARLTLALVLSLPPEEILHRFIT